MLIFVLCDGDVTKREGAGEMMYLDALEWLCLADYQSYVTRELMRKHA
jgi:hypothetical protein